MEQVKDIVKKFGGYIDLGGFALSIIAVFLPFIKVTLYGYSASVAFIKADWGIMVLVLSIIGAGATAVELFSKDLLEKMRNARLVTKFTNLFVGGVSLIVTIIEASRSSYSYTTLGIGFYLLLIATIAVIFVEAIKVFVIKDAAPVQPMQNAQAQFGQQMPNAQTQFGQPMSNTQTPEQTNMPTDNTNNQQF